MALGSLVYSRFETPRDDRPIDSWQTCPLITIPNLSECQGVAKISTLVRWRADRIDWLGLTLRGGRWKGESSWPLIPFAA